MFDFEDSKFGRVRIMSVTEARANIAAIMADNECNYVITKNNKPVRAIVNYDIFKKTSRPEIKSTRPAETAESIKGLLENRTKDLKQAEQKPAAAQESAPRVEVNEPVVAKKIPSQNLPTENKAQQTTAATSQEYTPPYKSMSAPPVKGRIEADIIEDDDYYKRYRKLYEPLIPPAQTPKTSFEIKTAVPRQTTETNNNPASGKEVMTEKSSLPSIQDILRDLEKEKLSDENDDLPLDTDDIKRLMSKISGSS